MNPNLITRSSYSFFQSLLSVEKIIQFAKQNNFKEVSLVEKEVLYSAYEFYDLALKNDLKPIIGLECNYQNEQIIVLAKNNLGFKNLIKISSAIKLSEEILAEYFDENVIIIDIKLSTHCYLEEDDKVDLQKFASINNVQLSDQITNLWTEEEFLKRESKDKYDYLKLLYASINLKLIAEPIKLPNLFDKKLNLKSEFIKILSKSLDDYLNQNQNLNQKIYLKRLIDEVEVINELNFISYFLMVADFVNFAHRNAILTGPGRGSAAGSLVVFLLKITTIDPIQNNLIFERFLNPKRYSLPDIDVDFEDTRREEVINYIVGKYGYQNVASIITFQTYRAKLALKDAMRLFDVLASDANELTKLMSDNLSLKENYNRYKSFRLAIENKEIFQKSYQYALKIENLVRQFSTHAAGLIISDNPVINYLPIQRGYNEKMLQTQYSMDFLYKIGLVKVDLLGLRNLTFLKNILFLVEKIYHKQNLLKIIDYSDQNVYKLFQSGKTAGIFQFESEGMIKLLIELKPDNFEDIVSAISLFRPGPMQEIGRFIKRKHGIEKIDYVIPQFEEILKNTYGIIVYQEQIIKIVQVFAGFSLADADLLQRAISKKNNKAIEELKKSFFFGAKNNNYQSEVIEQVYALIEKFANYGFNRSHAFAYSKLSFQLAWLKYYYKNEFLIALLNSVIGNKDKTLTYILEARNSGIEIVKPSIEHFTYNYAIVSKNKIRLGAKTIKGFGELSIQIIQEQIKKAKFVNFIDFVVRISLTSISKANVISLIKSGALDDFGISRNTMLNNLDLLLEYAELITIKDKNELTLDFSLVNPPELIIYPEGNYSDFEIEVFGFSLSKAIFKPVNFLKDQKNLKNLSKINQITAEQNANIQFVAMIISISEIKTKNNTLIAKLLLEDEGGQINAILWTAKFLKFKNSLKVGKIYLIEGTVDLKNGEKIIISNLELLENEN